MLVVLLPTGIALRRQGNTWLSIAKNKVLKYTNRNAITQSVLESVETKQGGARKCS